MRITLTLSRAHKVAERLRARAAEAATTALAGLGTVRIEGVSGASQLDALEASRSKAVAALATHDSALKALQKVRAVLGQANVTAGVSDLLAEQDRLNRRLQLLRGILASASPTAVLPEALADYRQITPVKETFGRGESGVAVTLLLPQTQEKLTTEADALQKELYKVSDELADANATRVEIELPDDLAAELGF